MFPLKLTATTAFGLEAIVGRELKSMGMNNVSVVNGGVHFEGDAQSIVKANLQLRCAERIFLEVGRFRAESFEELFNHIEALPWENWVPQGGKFPVYAKSVKSKLFSLSDIQSIGKKAIAKKLGQIYNQSWLEENEGEFAIHINLLKDEVVVNIDTTGVALHKRGYRAQGNVAPIKETLAAALVYLSGWKGRGPLFDPFCGSGTILIEAAMLARNIAPGLGRTFASESWPLIPKEIWKSEKQMAYKAIDLDRALSIYGSDKDSRAIAVAKENAEIAGVDEDIQFSVCDIKDFSSTKEYGSIITNPPYGERLENKASVEALYKQMAYVMENLKTWSTYVFTGFDGFETIYGKKATKNRKLYNGRLRCYYYQYHGPRPSKKFTAKQNI